MTCFVVHVQFASHSILCCAVQVSYTSDPFFSLSLPIPTHPLDPADFATAAGTTAPGSAANSGGGGGEGESDSEPRPSGASNVSAASGALTSARNRAGRGGGGLLSGWMRAVRFWRSNPRELHLFRFLMRARH